MKRDIEQTALLHWKNSPDRKPLLIRGARQVGKTYVVKSFATAHFDRLVEINFELRPELKKVFDTLDPEAIIKNLKLVLNQPIEPGRTLLFLDEIQDCPRAIMAMRYFYETIPQLQVIGAGSLLEFSLNAQGFKMPVGRVTYLYLQPLSFEEFLTAVDEKELRRTLVEIDLNHPPSEAVHERLLKLLGEYLVIGGMPAVVNSYLANRSSVEYQNWQLSLLQTYRDDFGKYAPRTRHTYLQKVFSTAPAMVGRRYKYSHVDSDIQSRELKEALHLLNQAGILYKVTAASAHGLPLEPHENKFKIIFLDTGLMQRSCGLDAEIAMAKDFLAVNAGALAEQFVGQEMLCSMNPHEDRKLFFWARDKKSSQAEVDYLMVHRSHPVPIEVKSGKTGTLKSLRAFMTEHRSKIGLRISQQPFSCYDNVLSIPLYAAGQIHRLLDHLEPVV